LVKWGRHRGSSIDSRASGVAVDAIRRPGLLSAVDDLVVGDAVIGIADDELAGLSRRRLTVGHSPSLLERATPDRPVEQVGGILVQKLNLPVTAAVVIEADGGVRGCLHE
jgi:hypothetical protein